MTLHGFGPTEFTLVLLRRMADFHPARVEDAVVALGVGAERLRAANRRWNAMVRSPRFPGGLPRYERVLGAADERRPVRVGDLDCLTCRWPLPLWPDLRFEVLAGPAGDVWNAWLVRADPAAASRLRTAEDLRPWECVVGDVVAAFPSEHRDPQVPSRWGLAVTAPGPDGTLRSVRVLFTWGLLQVVEPDPDAEC